MRLTFPIGDFDFILKVHQDQSAKLYVMPGQRGNQRFAMPEVVARITRDGRVHVPQKSEPTSGRAVARAAIVAQIRVYHKAYHEDVIPLVPCDCETLARQIKRGSYMSREDGRP